MKNFHWHSSKRKIIFSLYYSWMRKDELTKKSQVHLWYWLNNVETCFSCIVGTEIVNKERNGISDSKLNRTHKQNSMALDRWMELLSMKAIVEYDWSYSWIDIVETNDTIASFWSLNKIKLDETIRKQNKWVKSALIAISIKKNFFFSSLVRFCTEF